MRRLVYVDDGVPLEGTAFLRASCDARGVAFVPVTPTAFEFDPADQLRPGDMLYRPAVSLAAQRVEQHLFGPGVATFYRDDERVLLAPVNPMLQFARAGIPIPRTLECLTTARATLDRQAARLGGYPVLCKLPGHSGGIGVIRCDSPAALYSVADALHGSRQWFVLQAYIPDAVHWRLVVVGDRVVASYRNRADTNDFRTHASADTADYTAPPPPEAVAMAIRGTHVSGVDLGGVDVLHHPASDRCYLVEVNFPCYFAQAQQVAGVDVSGAMLDYLVAKATRAQLD